MTEHMHTHQIFIINAYLILQLVLLYHHFLILYRLSAFFLMGIICFIPRKNGDMWLANYIDVPVSIITFVRVTISIANLWVNLQNLFQQVPFFYQSFSASLHVRCRLYRLDTQPILGP